MIKKLYVQSVLPQEDVVALKKKSGESSIEKAIVKAVHHYLKCDKVNEKDKFVREQE